MGTTALFAELVVGGVLTLTWIIFIAASALGPSRITSIPEISATLTTVLVLGLAYPLGVVFDRLWDILLEVTGMQAWLRGAKQSPSAITDSDRKRRKLFGADAKAAVEFVNYHRSRMRIARASFFNFVLITISGLILLATRFVSIDSTEFVLAAVLGAILSAVSLAALHELGRTHDRVLEIVTVEDEDDN